MTFGRVFTDEAGDPLPQHRWTLTNDDRTLEVSFPGSERYWERSSPIWEEAVLDTGRYRPRELVWLRDGEEVARVEVRLS